VKSELQRQQGRHVEITEKQLIKKKNIEARNLERGLRM
jgi:hypothetical protein